MSIISTIALTGLTAAEKRVAASANNIANATTPGFTPQDVSLTATADGGVSSKLVDRDPSSFTTLSADVQALELPNVSLDEELVNIQSASYDYKATAQLIKAQRDLSDVLLNIKA